MSDFLDTEVPAPRTAPGMETASPEAEAAVLGACLMATPVYDPVADVARVLADGDWAEPANELVWQAVVRLHGADRPTGVPAVEAELRRTGELAQAGGMVRLSQLASAACTATQAGHYASIVHGYAGLRRYQATLVRGMQGARMADPLGVPETIAAHQAELEHLMTGDAGGEDLFGRFGDHLESELDAIEREVEAAAVTGLTDLDNLVHMAPGNVVLVAGRPAMGKSALTLGVALANASTGRPTLVHSLEMGRSEVTKRILSAKARVGLHHLVQGGGAVTDDDWTRIARHLPELSQLPLWVDYAPRVSPARVRSRIKALTRETGRAPLVIIDYVQLMETDQRNSRQSPYERVTEISRELKITAEETGAVIICCAQLNRGSEHRTEKKPQVSDLRDSGALEQDASVIILLHREDAYEKESLRAGESDLIVGKNRNGPTATVTVAHQFHYSRLRDMAPDPEDR
ncbi:DnaB-like helicase C-terminal domain-containing protein [Streptomyces lavendulocolor]|uniref:DNA 5'-3' helicase n=1 Tax=Streptomyces lavendulocolor TaxID=67316 RepID=A0ABV2WGI4_9ACTN